MSVDSNLRVRCARNLEHRTPAVHVGRCHSECLMWAVGPAALDPLRLRGPIDRNVNQPERCFFPLGQPLQCGGVRLAQHPKSSTTLIFILRS